MQHNLVVFLLRFVSNVTTRSRLHWFSIFFVNTCSKTQTVQKQEANSIIKVWQSWKRKAIESRRLALDYCTRHRLQLFCSFQCEIVRHKRTKWCEAMKSERESRDKKKGELNGMLLEEYLISSSSSFASVRLYFLTIVPCHHPSKRACFSYASHLYERWMILNDPLSRSPSRQNKNSQSESKNLSTLLSSLRSLRSFYAVCWLFYGLMATTLVNSVSLSLPLANHHIFNLRW